MYAMGIAAATAIDRGPINKAADLLPSALPLTTYSGHCVLSLSLFAGGLGLATIIDRRLTGKRCSAPASAG